MLRLRQRAGLPLRVADRRARAEDRYASVPELIRRALRLGVIGPHQRVDRTSVWRACVRLGLPLRRVPAKQEADRRRFAYPHRMMMVLADGKHFRAGVRRKRRVAVFFLDDATRFGLGVVVGTDETAELFLRGLHGVLRRFGFMTVLFLDRGPGFRADDTAAACPGRTRAGLARAHDLARTPRRTTRLPRGGEDFFLDETDQVTAARVLAHTCDQLGQILDDYRRRVVARLARERRADPF